MSKNESWKTWAIVVALLILSGVATVAWQWWSTRPAGGVAREMITPPRPTPEVIEIRVRDFLLGEHLVELPGLQQLDGVQVTEFQLFLILAAITAGALLAVGVPLAFIYYRLDRQAVLTKEEEAVQAAQAELEKREKARIQQLRAGKTAAPRPEVAAMPRWSIISTSLIILLFVLFVGVLLGEAFLPGETTIGDTIINPVVPFSWSLVFITVVILFFVFRGRWPVALEHEEDSDGSIPWDWIWVIVMGLVIVGIGTGLAIALRVPPAG